MTNYRIHIKLYTIDDIGSFIHKTDIFNEDIDLKYNSRTYDAKSLLAVMSIPLESNIEVELLSDNIEAQIDFYDCMKPFIIKDGE